MVYKTEGLSETVLLGYRAYEYPYSLQGHWCNKFVYVQPYLVPLDKFSPAV